MNIPTDLDETGKILPLNVIVCLHEYLSQCAVACEITDRVIPSVTYYVHVLHTHKAVTIYTNDWYMYVCMLDDCMYTWYTYACYMYVCMYAHKTYCIM